MCVKNIAEIEIAEELIEHKAPSPTADSITDFHDEPTDEVVVEQDVMPEDTIATDEDDTTTDIVLAKEDVESRKTDKKEKPKKKKVIKKPKKNDDDDYLQQLMEAEIPKTQLEKYEKIDIDSDKKQPIKPDDAPVPVIEKKAKQIKKIAEPVAEVLEPIQLKPRKPVQRKEESPEQVPTKRLKSRLVTVPYPPEILIPVISDINATRQSGELSRTIEEAEKLKKTKPKKFKQPKKPITDLEKVELETYEKYESEPEEPAEPSKYQRPEKTPATDEPEEKTLKLGKGKVKVAPEEEPEVVRLKKIPGKTAEQEEIITLAPKKGQAETEQISPETVETTITIGKFEPTEIGTFETHTERITSPEPSDKEDDSPETKATKYVKKKKTKPAPETIPAQIIPGVPKPKEISPEPEVSFKYEQKPKPDEPVDTIKLKPFERPIEEASDEQPQKTEQSEATPKPEDLEPAVEHIKTKKKKPKKQPEEISDVTLSMKSSDVPIESAVVEEEDVEFVIKPKKPQATDEDVSADVSLAKPIQRTDDSAEASLTIEQEPAVEEAVEETIDVKLKKKKPKKRVEQEIESEFTMKKTQVEIEDVTEQITLPATVTLTEDSAEASLDIQKTEEMPQEAKIKLKKKKTPKAKDAAEASVTLKKPADEEDVPEGDFTIREPKEQEATPEDVDEEFTIHKPATVEADVAADNVTVKKPKRIRKPITLSAEDTIQIGEEILDDDDEVNVQLPRRQIPTEYTEEDIELEATLSRPHEDEPAEDVTQEFTIRKKPKVKPTQVFEEHDDEFTVKKLKKKPRVIEVPGYTDTENVTFRPRSTKTKEDVEQEFKIKLDSYAEEEVSMSGKVKLKKLRPKTYSEEAGEASIRITEEYDDGEGPIIEEIDDSDSEHEDTMYDVDEPDEYSQLEELPKEVAFKLKPKKVKPQYKVEDFDEEDVSIHTIKRKQKSQVTYDEDSLTLKKQPKRRPSTYLEGYYYLCNTASTFRNELIIADDSRYY